MWLTVSHYIFDNESVSLQVLIKKIANFSNTEGY